MPQQIDIVANLLMKVDGAEAGINKLKSSLSKLKMPEGLENSFKKSFSNLDTIFSKYRSQIEKGFETKSDVSAFSKTSKALDTELTRISKHFTELTGKEVNFKVNSKEITQTEKELQKLINTKEQLAKESIKFTIEGGKNGAKDIETLLQKMKEVSGNTKTGQYADNALNFLKAGNIQSAIAQLDKAAVSCKRFKKEKQDAFQETGFDMSGAIQKIIEALNGAEGRFKNVNTAIEETKNKLSNFHAEQVQKAGNYAEKLANDFAKDESAIRKADGAMQEYAHSAQSMAQQLGDLQQSTQYFFSLRNMINLLKRGIDDAIQSVKELDAAMTETAVVTDFNIADMWKDLPKYTQLANDLGATTQGAYETMTLYYQQGLNQQQAFELGAETMKMARIAGLDYAETTDMMTAALRGFNMELNETSAKRINDVYSKLAAVTASDTEELGTAMQRTASIAHSAGMSFEGTTAFLAQAIETTREPAENLGTAMKTIIARFQELKKNPLEISEVEGEEVDFNKVDAALKTIGVDLKDTNGQFRDLDKVFLDISQRWDGLTQTQQRYIATTAAGSRQQSRFIAMMSNYDRTMELMSAANNSAGASDEQFGKTMDSLEAKLNKLHNAWQQFTMGIANDKAIKFVVDRLTDGLGIVNSFINALTKFDSSGITKSLLSLSMAFMGLRVAGKGIGNIIGKAAGFVDPSKPLLGGINNNVPGQPTKMQATITNPIIAAIREVVAAIKHEEISNKANNNIGTLQDYKNAQTKLGGLTDLGQLIGGKRALDSKKINYTDVTESLKGLGDSQQREIMGSFPGLQQAMRSSTLKLLKDAKLSTATTKVGSQITSDIIKGMNKGTISVEKGLNLLRDTTTWGKEFGGQFSESALKEIEQMNFNRAMDEVKRRYTEANPEATEKDIAKQQKNFEKGAARLLAQGKFGPQEEFEYTKYDQLADKVGQVGSHFATAGQSVQQFGLFLSNLGLEGVGNTLMRIGSSVSSLGMSFNGLGKFVGKFSERWADGMAAAAKISTTGLKGVAESGSAFASAFTAGINPVLIGAAITAAVIGAIALIHNHLEKKAKEAGEEVRKNFEDGFTKNAEKIDSISSYKDRFNELSEGVDQFGHNISLSTEEYDEYLNISKELSEISPSLIAGYNAEGQAILKKGAAIDQVIDKLEEEKKLALDAYTSNDSIDKLIKEYQTTDTYKDYHISERNSSGETVGAFRKQLDALNRANTKGKLDFDVKDAIEQLGGGSVTSLSQLSSEQMQFVSQHYNDILNLIEEKNVGLDAEVKDGLKDAFGNLGGALNDIKTEGQPIIDAMRMWMGDEKLDAVGLSLGEEFVSGFNQGFDAIMTTGLINGQWTSDDYKTALQDYANEWKNLGGATSEYSSILEQASEKQNDYLKHIGEKGAVDDYKNNIEGLAQNLENLADKYKNTGKAGKIFAEQCVQQANALRNYTTEGALSLGEALNILSGKFTEARGAKERFDKATEGGDYYTAAEGFRSIADTVLDEKNSAGDGSLTAWTGAEALLGQKFVDNAKSWGEVEEQVKKVNKLFDDGIEGVYNFNDMLVEAVNSGKDLSSIGEVVDGQFHFKFDNLDNLQECADILGISEDVLAGMIDKARQFAAFNVGNNAQIRQALEQSDQAMVGQTYGKHGKSNLYMSEQTFREEAYRQGIRGDDYTKTKEDLTSEQNVHFLTVDSLKANKGDLGFDNVMKDLGLKGADKTLDNTVAALTKMGFTLEEQKDILSSDGIKLADGAVTDEAIEEAYKEQEFATENPTVAGIADNTGIIAQAATAILASMGILTQETKNDIAKATDIENNKATIKAADQDYTTGDAYLKGTSQLRAQIDDNNSTIALLQQGLDKVGANSAQGQEIQAQIDLLNEANERLGQGLTDIDNKWAEKLKAAQENLQNIGKNEEEQGLIDNFAVDISSMMGNEDLGSALQSLTAFEEAANLSHTAVANLAQEFVQLRATDLGQLTGGEIDALLTSLGLTADEAREVKAELQSPFRIETQLTGADLENYVNEVDGLTSGVKSIVLNTELSGEEKVEGVIDEINNTFGDGDTKTKTVIIEATSKLASGDKEGANKLLTDAFGEGKAEEITKQLSILYDGSIANAGELQSSLESELDSIANGAGKKTHEVAMKVKAKVTANFDKAKVKDQNAKVNYTRGDQVDAKDSKAGVNYNKIINQVEPDNKTAGVSYNYISYQKPPETKHAKVIYDDGPHTGGFITTVGVLYRAKGGEAEWPGYPKKGTDRIPAYLSPGEYVQNRKAVDYFGIDFMRKINHRDLTGALQSFKSAARGMNIPNSKTKKNLGNQTTALVGEEGFEIGYIPSEGRSVIFGANGPEMTALPSDTIIYPHDQSKEILRRGKGAHKTAGSFVDGKLPSRSSGGGGDDTKKKRKKPTNNQDDTKPPKDTKKKIDKVIETAGKVSVWWENIARKTEATQRLMDKNAKSFENYIKDMRATLHMTGVATEKGGGGGDKYIKSINQYKNINQDQYDKATEDLYKLNHGNSKTSISFEQKQKKIKNGKVVKNKKGKAETVKKTVKEKVKLSDYITYNAALDTYEINQAKLDQVGLGYTKKDKKTGKKKKVKGNKKKAKAIKDAAEKKINEKLSKRNTAEDNIIKAEEALKKMGEDLYKTFFAWKTELTEIWNITQKIENTQKQIAKNESYSSLLSAQIASGQKKSAGQTLDSFKKGLKLQEKNITNRQNSISANKRAVNKAWSSSDEQEQYNSVSKKLKDDKTAEANKQKAINAANKKKADAEKKKAKAEERIANKQIYEKKADKLLQQASKTKNKKVRASLIQQANDFRAKAAAINVKKEKKKIEEAKKESSSASTELKKANNMKGGTLGDTEKAGYQKQQEELKKQLDAINKARQFMTTTKYADGTMEVKFDTAAYEEEQAKGNISEEMNKAIEEYVKGIQEATNALNEDYNSLIQESTEFYNTLTDLKDQWADSAAELVNINEESNKKQIDQAKKLSDSVNNALKNLLDQVKKTLDERRKQEDNAKTEKDISQKQQRLAALQADTTGGHQVEIAQLQQEIAQSQQDYQRSLEDQLLERLQNQADLAAQQREQQIALQESLLTSVNNIAQVNQWMADPETYYNEMQKAYRQANNYDEVTTAQQEKIDRDFETLYENIRTNEEKQEAVNTSISNIESALEQIKQIQEQNAQEISTVEPTPITNPQPAGSSTSSSSNSSSSSNGKATTTKTKTKKEEYQDKLKAAQKNKKIGGKEFAEVQKKANAAGIHARTYMMDLAKTAGLTWDQVIKAAEAKPNNFNKYRIVLSFNTDNFKKGYEKVHGKGSYKKDLAHAKEKKYKPYEYATGGLADYTGPAWLDGTPSKPELVLNAQDTKNFIALKDVLSKAIGSAGTVENTYGNATYEININVDHLNNDYDVDKVVERVKKKIVQDSSYRNVTQVRKFR